MGPSTRDALPAPPSENALTDALFPLRSAAALSALLRAINTYPRGDPQPSRQDHTGAARRGRRLQVLPDSDRGAARRSRGHAAGRDGSCAGSRPDHADPGPGHRPVPAVRRRGGQAAHCQRRRREGARARGVPTRAASGHNGARRADRLPLLQEVPVLQRAVQHVVRVGRRGGGRVRVSCSP